MGRAAATTAATAAVSVAASVAVARPALGQGLSMMTGGRLTDWSQAAVGSEEESYLRLLQVAGIVRSGPVSLRPFAAAELARLVPDSASHPWMARTRRSRGPAAFSVLAPGVQAVYNSGFPLSMNDGLAWAGRGVTAAARAGVAARWRMFSLRLEPEVVWAANRPIALAPNGLSGPLRFGDPIEPGAIDNPQRFGETAFWRGALGQSTARVDLAGVTLGVSTANQWIGPALVDPLLLGTNAPGFPHAFAGTSRPLNVGLGTVHLRMQAGRLDQSAYFATPDSGSRRLLTAASAVVTVRGVPGLELGATRLFHGPWVEGQVFWRRVRNVTQGFFIPAGDPVGGVAQNQLASVFGRWVFPGLEVYGEYMRNDASSDSRDLAQQPDHNSGWMVGTRRVWGRGGPTLQALRFETLNTRVTHLNRLRGQSRPYQHSTIVQGHTQLGEVLGSAAGQGGLATTIGWDRYAPNGRWTVEGARRVVRSSIEEATPSARWDVLHYLRVERLGFGRYHDLVAGAAAVAQLNRNFVADAYQLRLDLGWRFGTRRSGGSSPGTSSSTTGPAPAGG